MARTKSPGRSTAATKKTPRASVTSPRCASSSSKATPEKFQEPSGHVAVSDEEYHKARAHQPWYRPPRSHRCVTLHARCAALPLRLSARECVPMPMQTVRHQNKRCFHLFPYDPCTRDPCVVRGHGAASSIGIGPFLAHHGGVFVLRSTDRDHARCAGKAGNGVGTGRPREASEVERGGVRVARGSPSCSVPPPCFAAPC